MKAAFPSVGRGKLIHTIRGKGMDGDLIRWKTGFHTAQTVEKVIKGIVMERHPVKAGV